MKRTVKNSLVFKRRKHRIAEEAKKDLPAEAAPCTPASSCYEPREKPDERFYDAMRELSAIGNNINQLAIKANALGFVDTPMLREEARKWHEFQIDIRKRYLLPRRSS